MDKDIFYIIALYTYSGAFFLLGWYFIRLSNKYKETMPDEIGQLYQKEMVAYAIIFGASVVLVLALIANYLYITQ